MTWYLESEKLEEIRPLMNGVDEGGVRLALEIDRDGTAGLAVEKDGKCLKTLPKSLAKNETVLALKETDKRIEGAKAPGQRKPGAGDDGWHRIPDRGIG